MTTTNQTKREEFINLCWRYDSNIDEAWQWITAYKDQAVSEERERILGFEIMKQEEVPEKIDVIAFPEVAFNRLAKMGRNILRLEIMEKLQSLTPKEVTKQSDKGEIK